MKALYWFAIYLLVGIWSVLSPYVLNFTTEAAPFRSALAVGALLILISLIGMYLEREESTGEHFTGTSRRKTA